jgi:hypothetical protein
MKMLVVSIGVALAQWGAGSAIADSAVGVDMANGNTLNPPGRSAVPRPMADGGYDTVRHSPTGQLYGVPYDVATETNKTEGGWEYTGGIEAGALGGNADTKNALFRKYKDLNNSGYLNYFEIEADKAGTANYMSAFGGGTGQADQFYGMQFGRYNDWKTRLFYNETQHVFSTNWRSLLDGVGTGDLTITGVPAAPPTAVLSGKPTIGVTTVVGGVTSTVTCTAAAPCWNYGGQIYSNAAASGAINGIAGTYGIVGNVLTLQNTTQSGMAKAIADKVMPDSELSLVRKKGGARYDKSITDNWKSYFSYTQEARQGARPFSFTQGNNLSTEIAEPIDYTTHDFLAGVSYSDRLTQANLRVSASLFRNNISTLNVQFPLLSPGFGAAVAPASGTGVAGPLAAIQTATFDLYPDNSAFNLKGEFARSLPNFYHGRFNAAVSFGTSQQDDSLLAPISAAQLSDLARNGYYNPTTGAGVLNGVANVGFVNPALPGGTINIANWINTQTALSQQTGKQRIDTALLDLGLSVKPIDALSMKGSFRFYDSANKGGYTAYNPSTGQFGRGPNDGNGNFETVVGWNNALALPGGTALPIGAAGSCYLLPGQPVIGNLPGQCAFGAPATTGGALLVTNGANTPVFGQARSTQQKNYGLSGDYDLTRTSSINAAYEREDFTRNFRERENTWEDKFKLGFVNRGLTDATLRLSYEFDSKRGSDYRYRTFEDLGTGLPGLSLPEQFAAAQAQLIARLPSASAAQIATAAKYLGYVFPTVVTNNAGVITANLNTAFGAGLVNRYAYGFRKYDQADRDQGIFNARLNYQAREDLDLGLVFQTKDIKYPSSQYGVDTDKQDSLSLEMNYQPASGSNISAFYSYQQAKKVMNMNSGVGVLAPLAVNACTLTATTLYADWVKSCADGARTPAATWTSETNDRNNVLGVGFQTKIRTLQFGVDYTYASSSTNISYGGFGIGALAVASQNAAQLAIAGTALPSMTFVNQTLSVNLLIPVSKKLSVRLYDRLEIGGVTDWHYDNVVHNAVTNYDLGATLLDSGPAGYRANVIGFFLQYQL